MKASIFLLLLLTLNVKFINAQLHGTSPNWTPQDTLPKLNPSASATKGGTGQNIIRLGNGDLVQCYLEQFPYPNGGTNIYLVKSQTDGISWNTPVNYNPTTYFPSPFGATIAKDTSNNIHMVWITKPTYALYYSKMDANFNVLIDTIKISDFVIADINAPYITVDRKNRVHVMWNDGDVANTSTSGYFSKVMYVRSPDGGQSWESQKILSDTTVHKHAAFPRANFSGADGDTLAIPWRQQVMTNVNWDVWMAYSIDGGSTWTRTLAAGTSDAEWDPGIVIDKNSRIHLHYHEYQQGNMLMSQMEYAYSDNLGQNWYPANPFQTISPAGIRSQLSVFAYDYNTNVQCICWKDERDFVNTVDSRADIMCSFSTDGGVTWQGQEFVTDRDTTSIVFKSVEVGSNGSLYLTYEYGDVAGKRTIYFSKRSPVLTSINSQVLSESNHYNIFPNPFSNQTTIQLDKSMHNATLILTNYYGQKVSEINNINGNMITIERKNLPAGIYFAQLKENNQIIITAKLAME